MTPRLPRLIAKEVERVLTAHGFVVVRQHGSHRILRDSQGHRVTLPVHGHKILHPRVLQMIIEDAGLSPDDFG